MKTKLLCLCALLLSPFLSAGEIDLTKPIPRMRLADGRIFQNVEFKTFRITDIIIKHKAGPMVIRYEFLPDEIRAAAEQKRPGGPQWYPGETTQNALQIEGQVFVQTQGQGPYKFGSVSVYAFDAKTLTVWDETNSGKVKLPKPLARATSDGDGRFKLSIPKDTPYFIFCQAQRLFSDGSKEVNEWRVPGEKFKNIKEAFLTGENTTPRARPFEIEETP